METGDEKMEIAFKRDDKWNTAIYPRSTIFSSRAITALADLGCTITSENAKQVVRFLGALEAENIDIIPKADATGTFGWQPGGRFLPGRAEGITLDIDPSQRGMAAAYCQNGTFEKWIEHMYGSNKNGGFGIEVNGHRFFVISAVGDDGWEAVSIRPLDLDHYPTKEDIAAIKDMISASLISDMKKKKRSSITRSNTR